MVKNMPIPKYTHQQFAVLDTLLKEGELSGARPPGRPQIGGVRKYQHIIL